MQSIIIFLIILMRDKRHSQGWYYLEKYFANIHSLETLLGSLSSSCCYFLPFPIFCMKLVPYNIPLKSTNSESVVGHKPSGQKSPYEKPLNKNLPKCLCSKCVHDMF